MDGKDLRDLNKVGKRIKWCREQLKMPQSDVSHATGLSQSSYSGRENGVRAIYFEEYWAIAEFFDEAWIKKFKTNFPEYEDQPIKRIGVKWLMFGTE